MQRLISTTSSHSAVVFLVLRSKAKRKIGRIFLRDWINSSNMAMRPLPGTTFWCPSFRDLLGHLITLTPKRTLHFGRMLLITLGGAVAQPGLEAG